jgi:hypothetical protein
MTLCRRCVKTEAEQRSRMSEITCNLGRSRSRIGSRSMPMWPLRTALSALRCARTSMRCATPVATRRRTCRTCLRCPIVHTVRFLLPCRSCRLQWYGSVDWLVGCGIELTCWRCVVDNSSCRTRFDRFDRFDRFGKFGRFGNHYSGVPEQSTYVA